MMRVVSLLPSATEIVAALGFREELVGRSHECDFPDWVGELPVLTRPAFKSEGSSLEIDRRVKSLVENALSLYQVDAVKIRELNPDFIVTQSQCEVCAVSEAELEKALSGWVGHPAKILSLKPDTLGDIWNDILFVAENLGVPERGKEMVKKLKGRMESISRNIPTKRPTVACIEWLDPLMAAGNWMPELVEKAGGQNLFGVPGEHSPWMSWEDLRGKDPDVILIMPCGFDILRTKQELHLLRDHPGWQTIRAVKEGLVYLADGNQYFNRPGPRLVESLEILAEILHPDLFHFGHEGKGWKRAS